MSVGFSGPLVGLRVVDVGQLIAGPLAATMLADYGADVVKVEKPGRGDPLRQLAPHKGDVPLWWKVNGRNKRTIQLDLKDSADREVFLELVAQADVVTENYVPGTMADLGIDYERLKAVNPRIIMLSTSGYGQYGPRSRQRAFGRTAEGYSGMAYITGYPDRPPLHSGFPVADCVSGVLGALAVLAAVYEREHNPTGEGQHIDLALFESPFRLMEFLPIAYDQLGQITERKGTTNSYVAPVGTWQTRDKGWVSFTGSTQEMVERLFKAIGRPELIDDPRFVTNSARVAHFDELDAIVTEWIANHDQRDVIEILEAADVAIGPVLSIEGIFNDEQYKARGSIITVDDPDLGPVRMTGIVPQFSRTPGEVRHAGHGIDQDRAEILHDWLGR